jgi:hypothetical protein
VAFDARLRVVRAALLRRRELITELALAGEDVCLREQRTRRVLGKILLTDARNRHPLGEERVGTYDLLISGFCLDCLSQSKAVWRRCMRNVFGLLEPGGAFVLLALRDCKAYRIGERWFPAADIPIGRLGNRVAGVPRRRGPSGSGRARVAKPRRPGVLRHLVGLWTDQRLSQARTRPTRED